MQGDLTTVANLKAWMNTTSNGDDVNMGRVISSVSQVIRNYCQRDSFLSTAYSEAYDGKMVPFMLLKQFPVLSISSLIIGNQVIPAAPDAVSNGYRFDSWDGIPAGRPAELSLQGFQFWRGQRNVLVQYRAGYQISGEVQTVPNDSVYRITPQGPWGPWGGDVSVAYVGGAALVPVASSPSVGQYVAPQPFGASPGNSYYQFAAADASRQVALTYSFIPIDIENCAIELAAERMSYRKRIGERSHSNSAGGETVSFNITDFPPWAKTALQSYRSMVPL